MKHTESSLAQKARHSSPTSMLGSYSAFAPCSQHHTEHSHIFLLGSNLFSPKQTGILLSQTHCILFYFLALLGHLSCDPMNNSRPKEGVCNNKIIMVSFCNTEPWTPCTPIHLLPSFTNKRTKAGLSASVLGRHFHYMSRAGSQKMSERQLREQANELRFL